MGMGPLAGKDARAAAGKDPGAAAGAEPGEGRGGLGRGAFAVCTICVAFSISPQRK